MADFSGRSCFAVEAALVIAATVFLSACDRHEGGGGIAVYSVEATIGVATMRPDGTIILHLRADMPSGGEGYFEYPPGHRDYGAIMRHVGPLSPGKTVVVKPWP